MPILIASPESLRKGFSDPSASAFTWAAALALKSMTPRESLLAPMFTWTPRVAFNSRKSSPTVSTESTEKSIAK